MFSDNRNDRGAWSARRFGRRGRALARAATIISALPSKGYALSRKPPPDRVVTLRQQE
jgi:hypothetical protein